MRVKCKGCGYNWIFTSRVSSWKLKRSYWVRCPKCRSRVFKRKKNDLMKTKEEEDEAKQAT